MLEALNQKGETLRPEALQDLSLDTSLLLDRDYIFSTSNTAAATTKTKQSSNTHITPINDNTGFEKERKRYETEIAFLKKKLIEQRLHFQKLLELPSDLERQLRRELGDKRFEQIYYNNKD